MESDHVEPYVQMRLRQAEAQRAFELSDVAASERRARHEFDEAERIYRIKKQALIFAQINVKNSKLFSNLQSINNQCDRSSNSYPDSRLPNNFNQMLNQSMMPPADDEDLDSSDVGGIFSTSERRTLGTISQSIAPSYLSLGTNLSSAPINLSSVSSPVPAPAPRQTVPLPPMESCAPIVALMGRWPSICKTYTMRWQPNRVGACPRHVLRKEKCPGASCELWKNIERDLRLTPIPISTIDDMNTMEQQLNTMKESKKQRRLSQKPKSDNDTPNRKKARTESTNSTIDGATDLSNTDLSSMQSMNQ